eukprot:PhM_4_TR9796/c0_g1_i4/m.18854
MGCAPSHSSHRNHHNTSIQSYAVDDVSDLHSEDESVADKFNIKVSDVSKLPPAYKCKASVVVTTVPRPRKGCTITDVNELTFNHELLDDNNSNNNMSLQDTNSTDTTTATATTRARRRSIHEDLTRQSTQVFGQSNNTDTWDVVTDDDGHFQLKYPGPLGGWKREDKNIGYHVREIVLTHRRTLSSVHLTLGRCRTEDGGVRIPTLDDLASDVGAIPNVDNVELKYQNEQNNQENKYEKNDRNHHGSSNSSRRNSNSSSSSHVSEEGDNVCGDSGQNVIARSYVAYTVDRPSSFEKQALSSKVLGSAVVWSAVDIVRHAVGDGDDDEYEGDDEQEGGHDNDDDYAGGNNTHSNNENENINENYNDNNNNSTTSPSPSNMNNGRSFVVCQGRDDIDNDDDDEDFMTHIEGARFVGPEGWSYFDVTFVAAEDDWRVIGDVFSTIHSTLEMGWN